jgi:hypothetical protein
MAQAQMAQAQKAPNTQVRYVFIEERRCVVVHKVHNVVQVLEFEIVDC